MIQLKIEDIEGRAAILLDDASLKTLGAERGDVIAVDESGVTVVTHRTETERQLAIARDLMVEHQEVLAALAR
ncbi:MAG: hypothetical protein ACK4Y4_01275 [Brevundimonas sp.]